MLPFGPDPNCTHSGTRQAVFFPETANVWIYCLGCGAAFQAVTSVPVAEPAKTIPVAVPAAEVASSRPPPDLPPGVMVRAKSDIPPFAGPKAGEVFRLKAGDVATIPAGAAEILMRRGKAEPIEVAA